MNEHALPRSTRVLAVAVTAGLALSLTACSGSSVTFSPGASGTGPVVSGAAGSVGTDGASGAAGSVGTDGATGDAGSVGTDEAVKGAPGVHDGTAVLPEFPAPRVPDLSSMTGAAAKVSKTISRSVQLPPGVEVTGARCAADGSVVNRSGATIGAGDDGSQVVSRGGVAQVGAGGGGQVTGGGTTYQVEADGSGQVTTPAGVLQVEADGSGQFTLGGLTFQVDSDGGGQYSTEDETYQVEADGSGMWTSDEYGVVVNHGDGSGSWTGPAGMVQVNGDGTGTLDAVEQIKVAPMPKFAPLGKLPKLNKLRPVGKPCGTLIRLSAGLLFDFDSDQVRPEAKKVLAAVAKAIGGRSVTIQVNGHTDAKGSDTYNLDLSERRAGAVVTVLKADGLTAPLEAQGFGETQPVAPNTLKGGADNPVGRQLNRRVEIVVPSS